MRNTVVAHVLPGIGMDLQSLVEESIYFLRQHEPPEGYFLGFSGGKDSIATMHVARMAGVKFEAWHSCTRIDPPEVYRHMRKHYPDVQWAMPKMTFWEGIRIKMPPLKFQRWCCDVLKKEPVQHHALRHRVMGIRAEESSRRAGRPRIDWLKKHKCTAYKPIFYWPEWAVWELIESESLPYPSLYDEGFGRIGCVICPYLMGQNQQRVRAWRARWPGMYRAFESAVRKWWDEKGHAAQKSGQLRTVEEYLDAYYHGFEGPWGKHLPHDLRLVE